LKSGTTAFKLSSCEHTRKKFYTSPELHPHTIKIRYGEYTSVATIAKYVGSGAHKIRCMLPTSLVVVESPLLSARRVIVVCVTGDQCLLNVVCNFML